MFENRRPFDHVKRAINPDTEWIRPGKDPIGDNLRAAVAAENVDPAHQFASVELELWQRTYASYVRAIKERSAVPETPPATNVIDISEGLQLIRAKQALREMNHPRPARTSEPFGPTRSVYFPFRTNRRQT